MNIAERMGSMPSAPFLGDQQLMPVPVGFMRVGSVTAIPALLKSRGHDLHTITTRLGVDARLFFDPDKLIPIVELGRILQGCAGLAGLSHLGLLLGRQVELSRFGSAGQLACHAKDVGSALRDIVRYLHLHGSGVIARLDVEGDTAVFSHVSYDSDFECADQIADRAMAGVCNMMRTMCGIDWTPDEVHLPHRPPKNAAPFAEH